MPRSKSRRFTVAFAGGGTAGHVYPLLAIAEQLKLLGVDSCWLSMTAVERNLAKEAGIPAIKCSDLIPGNANIAVRILKLALIPLLRGRQILKRCDADLVFSSGGYAATPGSFAAVGARRPIWLLEQNAFSGMVIKALTPFSERVYLGFNQTLQGKKYHREGIPLRAAFEGMAPPPNKKACRVLVVGGSSGAQGLFTLLWHSLFHGHDLHVTWVTGRLLHETVRRELKALSSRMSKTVTVDLVEYATDIQDDIAKSDVIVTRGGASALAEIVSAPRKAIVVPLPHAAKDHQRANAQFVAGRPWVKIVEQADGGEALHDAIEEIRVIPNPVDIDEKVASVAAARRIAQQIVERLNA